MRSWRIVAAAVLPHNVGVPVALLDRREEARPLLLVRLALGTASGLLALAALAGVLDLERGAAVLLLAAFLAVALEVEAARHAASPQQLAEGCGSGLSLEEALAVLAAGATSDEQRRMVDALTRTAREEPLASAPREAA